MAHACIPLRFERRQPRRAERGRPARQALHRGGAPLPRDPRPPDRPRGGARASPATPSASRNQEARAMAAISRAIGGSLDIAVHPARGGRDGARAPRRRPRLHPPRLGPAEHDAWRQLGGAPAPGAARGAAHRPRRARRPAPRPAPSRSAPAVQRRRLGRNDPRVNRALAERWRTRSALIVPLVAHERDPRPARVSTRATPRRWTEAQVEVAEALAAQAAVALENARLYEEARPRLQELKDAQAADHPEREDGGAGHVRLRPGPRGAQPAQLHRPPALDARAADRRAARPASPGRWRSWRTSSARRSAGWTAW